MGFFQYQENQQIWQKIRFVPLLIYFSVPQSIQKYAPVVNLYAYKHLTF